jgi:two-component system response regulator RegA
MLESAALQTLGKGRKLLFIDPDTCVAKTFCTALSRFGFVVAHTTSADTAKDFLARMQPEFVVLDIKLDDANGLHLLAEIRAEAPDARAIIWTRHGSIETAVAAAKQGVGDYLLKSNDINDLLISLLPDYLQTGWDEEAPLAPNEVRWQHIQTIYKECNFNMSETARRAGMHRRTLQRIMKRGMQGSF